MSDPATRRNRLLTVIAVILGFIALTVIGIEIGLSGFDAYGLFVLVSVLFVAFRDIWTRTLPVAIPTLLVSGATAVVVTIMGEEVVRGARARTDSGSTFEAWDMLMERPVALRFGWRDPGASSLLPEARRGKVAPRVRRGAEHGEEKTA